MCFKKTKYFFSFLFFVGLLSNCRKYRDDDRISFKTPSNRIVGHWQIDYFFVNFQDSSYNLYSTNSVYGNGYKYYLKNLQLEFGIEHTLSSGDQYWIKDGPNNFISFGSTNNRTAEGGWKPNESYENILVCGFDFEYRVPCEIPWNILKLTDKEFHLQTNCNNKSYEIYFKKY